MQKIQKFQLSNIYSAPKSKNTFELIERNGRYLIFRVHKPKDSTSYKITATSFYKADQNGAFEEVLLQDGTRIRSNYGHAKAGYIYPFAA